MYHMEWIKKFQKDWNINLYVKVFFSPVGQGPINKKMDYVIQYIKVKD